MRERVEIHTEAKRKKCAARRDPHWGPQIRPNLHLGFRKTLKGSETWIARFKREDKTRIFKPLGPVDALEHADAVDRALNWWKDLERGIGDGAATVASVCRDYVNDRRSEVSEGNAHDAERRFERTIYGTPFGETALSKIRATHIKTWRNGLVEPADRDTRPTSKASANRTLTSLKAALNLAVANRAVSAATAIEWASVKAYPNASKRRDLYLDLDQRRALLKAAEGVSYPKESDQAGAIRDLMEAVMVTGARAGELVDATRSQFDARTESITLKGKTGTRTVQLSAAAVKLFERRARLKTPHAFLFVRDDGRRWGHSDWDKLVREAAARAGLPAGVCLYTLRHSWISSAIMGGMTTLDVARLAGTSVMMIEKHYGHLVDSHIREKLSKVVMI